MDKFIINEKAFMKNILIKGDVIYTSDENYETEEVFWEKVNNSKKSILDTYFKIQVNDIIKFIPTESEFAIQLFFNVKNKKEKTYFQFKSKEEFLQFKEYLINKTSFTLKNEIQNSFAAWGKKGLYTILATIIVAITYFMAKDIEKGHFVSTSGGSRRGLKKLMKTMAESLGSTNTLIIGIVVVAGFSFWTYRSYKEGKKSIELYS